MRLTHGQARTAHGILHEISSAEKLPLRARYRVYQLLRVLEGPVGDSDRILGAVMERHLKRDASGLPVYSSDQRGEPTAEIADLLSLRREQAEVLAVEVELEVEPLRASELGEVMEVLSPAMLAAMGPMFEWDSVE